MPHLLVDISSHGYGHVGQTAPVINAIAKLLPSLRITVRTAAPFALLQRRLQCKFTHIPVSLDFGLSMANAVDVEVDASATAYRDFHSNWDAKVQHEAQAMRTLSPDLLLADVPYLSLAAAHAANIPSVAMCSLNWADIYRHYCVQDKFSPSVFAQISAAYNNAACFLRPQPSMPMADFANTRSIGPLATIGINQRTAMLQKIPHTPPQEKLVLVGMGGIEFRLAMEKWPRIQGVHWLIPEVWNITRQDISVFDSLDLSYSDILASCDAILTKPGYGTFAEAACAGVPVLSVVRQDWPETPYLVDWLKQNGRCIEVERQLLETGDFNNTLQKLWSTPQPPIPSPTGADEAAQYLCNILIK